MRSTLKQRLQAGSVHLGISALIASGAMALVFLLWYPAPLAEAQGVSRLVLILIGVDVAIGPLITVIIFNRAKKSLRMDLAVVACLQLTALLYGLYSIFIARPAIVVFNADRFDVVTALDVDRGSLRKALAAGKPGLPWGRPSLVAARPPQDPKERQKIMFSAVLGGSDLPQMAQWYEPYAQAKDLVVGRIRPLSELRVTNRMQEANWAAFVKSLGRPQAELGYLPLRAKVKDGVVIVDARTADILRIALLEPQWEQRRPGTASLGTP